MSDLSLTPQQRAAIETTGCSLIVSAAAGSGKTFALARRCAYLICDAPPGVRCDVENLLVLTFTEAAAAEMRSRIVSVMRERQAGAAADVRLREQIALVDSARISTIHSFCLWVIRRWFAEAGVDPGASLMDEHEATMLARETLAELFDDLYEVFRQSEEGDGDRVAEGKRKSTSKTGAGALADDLDADFARDFVQLVDDYALGDDRTIERFVRRLYEFSQSLPDPDAWLEQAVPGSDAEIDLVLLQFMADLPRELQAQMAYVQQGLDAALQGGLVDHAYPRNMQAYIGLLEQMAAACPAVDLEASSEDPQATRRLLDEFEALRQQYVQSELVKERASGKRGEFDEQAKANANEVWTEIKKDEGLWPKRIKRRFLNFSLDDWRRGMRQVSPYGTTIVHLVRAYRERFAARKRAIGLLDFSDLERLAYDAICVDGDPTKPSAVATALQRRFHYVLVDEFQDINPLQDAIIRLVSRERWAGGSAANDAPAHNLFVVGDVKQSIYRFRLAEPGIFLNRLRHARPVDASSDSAKVFLSDNFRSRAEVTEAANALFTRLMSTDFGGVAYDEDAKLRCGRQTLMNETPDDHRPVEVHLLENKLDDADTRDAHADEDMSDADTSDPDDDPAGWKAVEREAYLIAERIRQLRAAGETNGDGEPYPYRDMAILLRSPRVSADRMAGVLAKRGVPAFAAAAGSLLDSLEVRDLVACLQFFDNGRQDIPLAAVLRNGMVGERFDEDELVAIRLSQRGVPFHAAYAYYLNRGDHDELVARLQRFDQRVRYYRRAFERRPVAEVLWQLYEESGHLAYIGSLPNGEQRRANLIRLHELARKFGSFRLQGLPRFLRFLESIDEQDQQLGAAPAIGEGEDVVRIMSIHASKGLEFPVVFLAGLGTRFNDRDTQGRMLFARQGGIGLRVVRPADLIEYESAQRMLVENHIHSAARAEELRTLYVAMTRARERLVLVGSVDNVEKAVAADRRPNQAPLTPLARERASNFLKWILPTLGSLPPGDVSWNGPGGRVFEVYATPALDIVDWQLDDTQDEHTKTLHACLAEVGLLPAGEPQPADLAGLEDVLARIDFEYDDLTAATTRAVLPASEFKGTLDFQRDPAERRGHRGAGLAESRHVDAFVIPPSKYARPAAADDAASTVAESPRAATAGGSQERAAARGTAMHRALQYLSFQEAMKPEGVARELQRLVAASRMSADQAAIVDIDALNWFMGTPLASRIAEAGDAYRRELVFLARESPTLIDADATGLEEEHVQVRGMVDGVLPAEGGVIVVDFKTDALSPGDVAKVNRRVAMYRPQMRLYGRAVSRLWRQPVLSCQLVLLSPRQIVKLTDWDDG